MAAIRRGAPVWSLAGASIFLLFVVLGCEPGEDPAARSPLPDSPSQRARPLQVVSLSPLGTRFVIELGAQDQLVGVDPDSGQLPGLEAIERVDLADAYALSPDVVLIPPGVSEEDPGRVRLVEAGAQVYEFGPHDIEEVVALFRAVGSNLVGPAQALAREISVTRPLGMIGGESYGQPRPRVLAIVSLRPTELAGGHSFETDLIEFAGGKSLTHGGDDTRLHLGPTVCRDFSPDLVLLMLPEPPSAFDRDAASAMIPCASRFEFFEVDAEQFWLEKDQATARRLRALIESLVQSGIGG